MAATISYGQMVASREMCWLLGASAAGGLPRPRTSTRSNVAGFGSDTSLSSLRREYFKTCLPQSTPCFAPL